MAKPPAALKVSGNKLEDFLPLLSAEEALRKSAASGQVFIPEDYSGKRPTKSTDKNTIRSEFLRYMVLGGCERSPVHSQGIALDGVFVKCDGDEVELNLASISIHIIIKMSNCLIDGFVNLQNSSSRALYFANTEVKGILGESLNIKGRFVFKNQSVARQKISMRGAKIENNVDFKKAIFQDGIDFQHAIIKRDLSLEKSMLATGSQLQLRNAQIGGTLNCKSAQFLDTNTAISANRAEIHRNVELENMKAEGTIALTGSVIGGDFQPQNAQLSGSPSLQLRNTKIAGTLHWRGIDYVNGEVDLSGASCTTLNTGKTSWMRKAENYIERTPKAHDETEQPKKVDLRYIKLDNFTYHGFTNLPDDSRSSYWINWLKQQPDEDLYKKFKPRPWEQLAGVLDNMGFEEEARDVRIEKQYLQTRFMQTHENFSLNRESLSHWAQIFFRKFLWGPLVSYGYRPGNAILWLFVFVLFGTAVYSQAAKEGIMAPTHPLIYKEARAGGSIPKICAENWVYFKDKKCASAVPSEHSEFQSFVYALDVALPVVNFRMEDDWAPSVVDTSGKPNYLGYAVRYYEWFLIAVGWILSLLFVSAVGSSLRR